MGANLLGLPAGLPMLAGVMDTSAAVLLTGAADGQLINVCGTTDVLAMCVSRPQASSAAADAGTGDPTEVAAGQYAGFGRIDAELAARDDVCGDDRGGVSPGGSGGDGGQGAGGLGRGRRPRLQARSVVPAISGGATE